MAGKIILIYLKRLGFYWFSSFFLATMVYWFLWAITPGHYVFGILPRMYLYHYSNPEQYILIPCFFYGLIAAILSGFFSRQHILVQILITIWIILTVIMVSIPIGGMLWVYHDMQAGFFPRNWVELLIIRGISYGLDNGGRIIIDSFPYNIIGSFFCFFLTKAGTQIFPRRNNENQSNKITFS